MRNKNLAAIISALLLNGSPVGAMDEEVEQFPENSKSLIIKGIDLKKDISSDSLDLSPKKQKVSKTLPLNRRKSSGSPRNRPISSPKSISPNQSTAFLEDQKKNDEWKTKESSNSSPDEQKESPRRLSTDSQEKKKESSPRSGYKKYSLVGPIDFKQMPLPNSPQWEQTNSPGRDGAISPMRQSRDQVF